MPGVAEVSKRTGFEVAQAEALGRWGAARGGSSGDSISTQGPQFPSPKRPSSSVACTRPATPITHMCQGPCAKAAILGKPLCPPRQAAALVSQGHRHVPVLPPRGQHGKREGSQPTREGSDPRALLPLLSFLLPQGPATPTCALPSHGTFPPKTLPG